MAVFNKYLELKEITDIKVFFKRKVFELNTKRMIFMSVKEKLIVMWALY
ncbi:hypothetical protein KL86DYS1_20298 [uncultured Dysgonomonas sp.]|uniref:Uncharacterized protein n=1 Tax=uncultured Dysgonomonas sp. TaxID=206096 RepID=A0A212JN15_9BACT|nr:hypothetical protein KL86DYS1_20298 [uncultured Dysgonomonas sp.]